MLRSRSISPGRFIPPPYGTTSTAIYALWLLNRIVPDLFWAAKILAGISGAVLLLSAVELARTVSERAALLTGILQRIGIAIMGFLAGALPQMFAAWRYYGNPIYSENLAQYRRTGSASRSG